MSVTAAPVSTNARTGVPAMSSSIIGLSSSLPSTVLAVAKHRAEITLITLIHLFSAEFILLGTLGEIDL